VEGEGPECGPRAHRTRGGRGQERGGGGVSFPADANPADNEFYFVFDKPVPRQTIVVADDPLGARPLELAAAISPDPSITCVAEGGPGGQLVPGRWRKVSRVRWQ